MNLAISPKRFLHQVDVFDDTRIHGGYFTRMMTAQDVVELVQRGEIVLTCLVTVPHPQPLIGVHVIKGQLAFR